MRISVEGLPGSGKTTILKMMDSMGYKCYYNGNQRAIDVKKGTEQVEQTERLERSEDIILSRRRARRSSREDIQLVESSPYILKKLLRNLRKRSPLIYPPLVRPSSLIKKDWKPDCIIFLDCHPDTALQRVPADYYLTSLQITDLYGHYDWVLHPNNCDVPVFRINCSGSILATLHHFTVVTQVIIAKINTIPASLLASVPLIQNEISPCQDSISAPDQSPAPVPVPVPVLDPLEHCHHRGSRHSRHSRHVHRASHSHRSRPKRYLRPGSNTEELGWFDQSPSFSSFIHATESSGSSTVAHSL